MIFLSCRKKNENDGLKVKEEKFII